MRTKKGLALLAAGGLSLSIFSAALPASAEAGFSSEINYLVEQNVLSGFPDGSYRPDSPVTRGQLAIMLGRTLGIAGAQADTSFPDVPSSVKASGYIAALAEAGVVSGYPDGTFKPDAPVTRGDMAIFMSRAFDLFEGSAGMFTDVTPQMKAAVPISGLFYNWIAAGYSDRTFRPYQPITRGEFSAFLARAMEPAFKNKVRTSGSFVRDMTKTYTYKNEAGQFFTSSYEEVSGVAGLPIGSAWVTRAENGEKSVYFETETPDQLATGFPYSELLIDLVFPVEEGGTFEVGFGETLTMTYTGTSETVETAYRTFTNAVEVTAEDGSKEYYVPGFNIVKRINAEGNVTWQLTGVE